MVIHYNSFILMMIKLETTTISTDQHGPIHKFNIITIITGPTEEKKLGWGFIPPTFLKIFKSY